MKYLVMLAVAIEIPTALVLIFEPSIFTELLFAAESPGPGNALAPLAGFGLVALAIACWPSRAGAAPAASAVSALLAFSLLCAIYLAYRGLSMGESGPLLWPAAGGHTVLGLLLLWHWLGLRWRSTTER